MINVMKIVKSCLRSTYDIKYERVLETSTHIYFYPMGDHKDKKLFAKKYNRVMNLIAEGDYVDNEIMEIFSSGNYSWISKKFENKFGILK